MKNLICALLCMVIVVPSTSFGKVNEALHIDIMPLQLQFRYEDSVEQSRQLQTYKGLFEIPIFANNLAYQLNDYRLSLGQSYQYEKSGNPSIEIRRSRSEFLLGAGYRVFQHVSTDETMTLDFFTNIFLGSTQTEVETKFLGVSSKSKSDTDLVVAAGASAVGRYKFLVVEADFKYLYSINMNPQYVPAFSLRAGGCLYF